MPRMTQAESAVRDKLEKLGYTVVRITGVVRGGEAHTTQDIICRWEADTIDANGKKVIIDGGASLTQCARSKVRLMPYGLAYGSFTLEMEDKPKRP